MKAFLAFLTGAALGAAGSGLYAQRQIAELQTHVRGLDDEFSARADGLAAAVRDHNAKMDEIRDAREALFTAEMARLRAENERLRSQQRGTEP